MKINLFKLLLLFTFFLSVNTLGYYSYGEDRSGYIRAVLVITSNSDCDLLIDDRKKVELSQGEPVEVSLSPGRHWLEAKCSSGKKTWSKEVFLTDFSKKTVHVEFVDENEVKKRNDEDIRKGTFTDPRDGKTYKVKRVGEKIWMVQNLAFNMDKGSWAYDFDRSKVNKYGYLYNWNTARRVCPAGWRLPKKEEFEQLLVDLELEGKLLYHALREGGTSGFAANCAGWRYSGDFFSDLDRIGSYWTSTSEGPEEAWLLYFFDKEKQVVVSTYRKECGFSVRCVWDE